MIRLHTAQFIYRGGARLLPALQVIHYDDRPMRSADGGGLLLLSLYFFVLGLGCGVEQAADKCNRVGLSGEVTARVSGKVRSKPPLSRCRTAFSQRRLHLTAQRCVCPQKHFHHTTHDLKPLFPTNTHHAHTSAVPF